MTLTFHLLTQNPTGIKYLNKIIKLQVWSVNITYKAHLTIEF